MTESEWLVSDDPQRMLSFLTRNERSGAVLKPQFCISGRKLRLFAVACCRQVWDRLTDESPCPSCNGGDRTTEWSIALNAVDGKCPDCSGTGRINRSRRAVEVAERYADEGEAVARQMGREWLWLDMESNHFHSWLAVYLACSPPDILARALREHGEGLSRLVAPDVQAALLREIVGNPWRKVVWHEEYMDSFEGYWATRWTAEADRIRTHNDGAVVKIAHVIYEERAWDLMPALHDALIEAGCDNEEMLRHCRGQERCPGCLGNGGWEEDTGGVTPWGESISQWVVCDYPCNRVRGWIPLRGPHVRGCWVLDLLLGKE